MSSELMSLSQSLVVLDERINLLDFSREKLEAWFIEQGESTYRARQVMLWLYHHFETDFSSMTNLSKGLRDRLLTSARVSLPEVASTSVSKDGTIKWLVRLVDGNCVETVFIPESGRGTLCVSSQVGCALNCTFCATASQGFNRNLSTAEIIGQVWLANHLLPKVAVTPETKVTNVVMMGMGEPLLNFENVVAAMSLMMDDLGFGLSKYRVTLSTSGVVPAMYELAKASQASLAVSLHAPNDALRNILVPINKKYPLSELLAACQQFFDKDSKRQIVMEYVMLKGVNDSDAHARELAKILQGIPAKVNLIPFNPYPGARYQCTPTAQIDAFREILHKKGIHTITRKTRGADIAAACGQLAGDFKDKTKRRERFLEQAKNDR